MLCDRGCLLLETEPHSPARNASKSDTVYSKLVENNPDAFNEQPDPDPATLLGPKITYLYWKMYWNRTVCWVD